MERTILSINLPNTITVGIMSLLAYGGVVIGRQIWLRYFGSSTGTQTSSGF